MPIYLKFSKAFSYAYTLKVNIELLMLDEYNKGVWEMQGS